MLLGERDYKKWGEEINIKGFPCMDQKILYLVYRKSNVYMAFSFIIIRILSKQDIFLRVFLSHQRKKMSTYISNFIFLLLKCTLHPWYRHYRWVSRYRANLSIKKPKGIFLQHQYFWDKKNCFSLLCKFMSVNAHTQRNCLLNTREICNLFAITFIKEAL